MKKVFVLIAIAAMVAVSCNKDDNNNKKKNNKTEDEEYVAPITIDGTFEDWAALDPTKVASAKCDEEATHTALKTVKVYADEVFVYVYFEWDKDQISYVSGEEHVPFHCYINGDGDATTGGYGDEFSDACSDLLLEGSLYDENGIASYDPGCYKWIGEANGTGWGWEPDGENILAAGSGLCRGAGVEGKYEFALARDLYPVGTMADTFSIGFDIQQNWESVGVLPNSHVTDENTTGLAPSLQVVTVK